MRTMRNLTIAVLALLGVATLASADHGYKGKRYDDRQDLQVLAHQLEQRADRLYEMAARQSHHRGFVERRALDRLQDFAEAAEHFHRQVERYRENPFHTRGDFRELRRSFHRAMGSLDLLHPVRPVYRQADRVSDLMRELQVEMAYYSARSRYDRGDRHVQVDRPRWSFRWNWSRR